MKLVSHRDLSFTSPDRSARRLPVSIAVFTALLLLALAPSALARTITVNTTSWVDNGSDAFCSLPEAIHASNTATNYHGCTRTGSGSTDTINLPSGTITAPAGTVSISRTVRIDGQGSGSTTLRMGDVYFGIWVGQNATLRLQRLTLRRQLFTSNRSGIFVNSGGLVLDRMRLGPYSGIGVQMSGGTLTVIDSELAGNPTAIFANHSDVALTSSSLHDNGTALHGYNTPAEISYSEFSDNTDTAVIFESDGFANLFVEHSRFEDNQGTQGGAIRLVGGADTQLRSINTLFARNVADGFGGAVYSTGQPFFYNTTFSGNTARQGGGFYHNGAESGIYNCTFAYNGATERGGGMYKPGGGASIYSYNIFANNTAPLNPDIDATFLYGDYNLVENTSGYSPNPGNHTNDVLGQDPNLGALQDLGGETPVHPLLNGSTAIDRIPASLIGTLGSANVQPVDQRGIPRPQNGLDFQGRNGADIGAYEQVP